MTLRECRRSISHKRVGAMALEDFVGKMIISFRESRPGFVSIVQRVENGMLRGSGVMFYFDNSTPMPANSKIFQHPAGNPELLVYDSLEDLLEDFLDIKAVNEFVENL